MNGIKEGPNNPVRYLWQVIQEYKTLSQSQVYVFLKKIGYTKRKERRRIVESLCRQVRIFRITIDTECFITSLPTSNSKAMSVHIVRCFWILLDYITQVEEHFATGTYSKISMIIGGKDYDIVYVMEGEERLCLSHMKQNGATNYIVVVEDVSQIAHIHHDSVKAFATVSDIGKVTYYSQKDGGENIALQ